MLISGCGQNFAHAQQCPTTSIVLATPLGDKETMDNNIILILPEVQ